MKKIIIGLLLLAAGGGVLYYLLNNKPSATTINSINKELVVGKWKLDTANTKIKNEMAGLLIGAAALTDSGFLKQEYDIQKEGKIIISLPGGATADTSVYEWVGDSAINWVQNDSAKTKLSGIVIKLDSLVFAFQTSDSTIYQFNRIK